MLFSQEAVQGSSQLPAMVSRSLHEDPVLGSYHVSAELQPVLATRPFTRLRKLKQLGVSCRVFQGAEHSRYGHSISVGVLARRLGDRVSNRVLLNKHAAGGDVVMSTGTSGHCDGARYGFEATSCAASKQELLQLELAGFAHDLGHGPWSHLWEKFMHSMDEATKNWSHEEMSEMLLDIAVNEAVTDNNLPTDHFLRQPRNITAVKAMIRGDSSGVDAPKKWLFSIVCNQRSGLDVDNMEFLLRDQHMVFGMKPPGRFSSIGQVDTLFHHARIVPVVDPGTNALVTDIAFEYTRGEDVVRLVDDIFQTRLEMHERVYQCPEVIALEERLLHLLHSAPQEKRCEWVVKSQDPQKFMHLDDSLLDQLAHDPKLAMAMSMFEGMHGGWRAAGRPWNVPRALLTKRTVSVLGKQIERMLLPRLSSSMGRDMKVRMTVVGDGAKGRSLRAVQKVPFFCGHAVQWFGDEHLKNVYGIKANGDAPSEFVYCHLQFWHGTANPSSTQEVTGEPPEHLVSEQLHTAFDTLWKAWVKEETQAVPRTTKEAAGAARLQTEVTMAHSSAEEVTPRGHKLGTVFSCKITQNGDQDKLQWHGSTCQEPSNSGVSSVHTPPRKRACEEDCTPVSVPVKMSRASLRVQGQDLNRKDAVIPDSEDGEDYDEENHGGVMTQVGVQ